MKTKPRGACAENVRSPVKSTWKGFFWQKSLALAWLVGGFFAKKTNFHFFFCFGFGFALQVVEIWLKSFCKLFEALRACLGYVAH